MVYCMILEYRLFMARSQVCCVCVASNVCWSVLLIVTDQMGRWGRNETGVQKGCSVKLVRLLFILLRERGCQCKIGFVG